MCVQCWMMCTVCGVSHLSVAHIPGIDGEQTPMTQRRRQGFQRVLEASFRESTKTHVTGTNILQFARVYYVNYANLIHSHEMAIVCAIVGDIIV